MSRSPMRKLVSIGRASIAPMTVKGSSAQAPAVGAFPAGHRVDDGVDVGGNRQPINAFVVSDVDDHGQVDLGDGRQSPGQTGTANPSRQHCQPHVTLPRLRYTPDRNTMSCPMTSPPGLPVAPPPAMTPGVPAVAVVVLSSPRSRLDETMAAVARQVYVPAQVLQVGRHRRTGSRGRVAAHPMSDVPPFHRDTSQLDDVGQILDRLDDDIEFVWLIHGDTRPRPDALLALAARNRPP